MGKKEEGFAFLGAVTAECKEEAIPVTHSQHLPSCPSGRKPLYQGRGTPGLLVPEANGGAECA